MWDIPEENIKNVDKNKLVVNQPGVLAQNAGQFLVPVRLTRHLVFIAKL